MKHKSIVSKERIEKAITESNTMNEAASLLKMNYRTFKRMATDYGLYKPVSASWKKKFEISDILNGKHPQYPTSKLSKRLVAEGYLKYECNSCKITEYNNKPISLELNHIDGNSYNHSIDNLELLCPNCHSQTDTYRSKKLKIQNGEVA